MSSRPRRRIRTLYVLAWMPLLALYTLVYSAEGAVPLHQALVVALCYVGPPAVFGVGVIRMCAAIQWSSEHRVRFFAKHLGLGLTFAGLSSMTTVGLMLVSPVRPDHMSGGDASIGAAILGQLFMGAFLYCILVGFTYAALGEIRRRKQAEAAARAEALRAEAELKALRAQVNPHFLFNTLHSLLALVRRDAGAAEDALEQFGDLMRYALRVQQESGDEVLLAEEWTFAQDYLALEKLRLGDRLTIHTEIDDAALSHGVPSFSLQPLLENSIGHAIAPRAAGGNIWIRASVEQGRLVLEVRDDGEGADQAEIEASSGTGLSLLRRRLEALYGDDAAMTTRTDDAGFTVSVEVPATADPSREEARDA
jgi:signal transduction histidine kinase